MLADNKLADRSTWDEPLLAAHLKELFELSVDLDIEATGFEAPEIDLRILFLDERALDTDDNFEDAKGPPLTRLGDCWVWTAAPWQIMIIDQSAVADRWLCRSAPILPSPLQSVRTLSPL